MPGKITRAQRKLIERLSSDHKVLAQSVDEFLMESGVDAVSDLAMDEASKLIELLKEVKKKHNLPDILHITSKQIALIRSLQDGEARIAITSKFLKEHDLQDPEQLSLQDASALINSLLAAKAGTKEERMQSPITLKQLHFIESLSSKEKKQEILSRFLKKVKKKDPGELNRSEARNLIDLLLETR